ncbi:MAG: sporulation protein YqfD [Clostridium sp.]|nr:sporulation protein YqfD [Clostridium sp.]
MLLFRLWNYLRGYVIIEVEGYFLEKFVNICTRRQLLLTDIKRRKNSRMTLTMSIKGFKMIRPIAKKTGCRVRILRKKGLPFLVYRYRGRKTFFLGAVVFVVLFYIMTSFVWTVEVIGNKKIETDIIFEKLASLGIKPGVLKYQVDPEGIATRIVMEVDGLSYVSVLIKGTKLKVEVSEGVGIPPMVPLDQPCDIIAKRDGVVSTVIAKTGNPVIKEGDTVKEGQLLVSGSIPIKNMEENPRQVHSIAKVLARTWYEGTHPVELTSVERVKTGQKKSNVSLVLFSKEFRLFAKEIDYEDYDKEETEKFLSLGKDLIFPFCIIVKTYYENDIIEGEVNLEEAKENAANLAYKKVLEDIPEGAEIIQRSMRFIEDENGSIIAEVILECLEDIALPRRMEGDI